MRRDRHSLCRGSKRREHAGKREYRRLLVERLRNSSTSQYPRFFPALDGIGQRWTGQHPGMISDAVRNALQKRLVARLRGFDAEASGKLDPRRIGGIALIDQSIDHSIHFSDTEPGKG